MKTILFLFGVLFLVSLAYAKHNNEVKEEDADKHGITIFDTAADVQEAYSDSDEDDYVEDPFFLPRKKLVCFNFGCTCMIPGSRNKKYKRIIFGFRHCGCGFKRSKCKAKHWGKKLKATCFKSGCKCLMHPYANRKLYAFGLDKCKCGFRKALCHRKYSG